MRRVKFGGPGLSDGQRTFYDGAVKAWTLPVYPGEVVLAMTPDEAQKAAAAAFPDGKLPKPWVDHEDLRRHRYAADGLEVQVTPEQAECLRAMRDEDVDGYLARGQAELVEAAPERAPRSKPKD